MTVSGPTITDTPSRRRWLWSFVFVFFVHVSAGATALFWRPSGLPPAEPAAAIMVDLAPVPAALPDPVSELPPGPQQVETPPEPETEPEPEPLPETPTVKEAEVVQKPAPKPKEREERKKEELEVEQTTAPATVQAPPDETAAAPVEAAPSLTQSVTSVTWQSALLGRLERFKRYPPEAQRARQEGIVYVRMVLDRQGKVLEHRIERGSGIASLDAEALALIDRAQPLPPPPPDIKGETIKLTVPIEFFLR